MRKISIELSKDDSIPYYLIKPDTSPEESLTEISFELEELCEEIHRDYHDDIPYRAEYCTYISSLLVPGDQFVFIKNGLGANTESRNSSSKMFGRGFCKFVLRRYWDMRFFTEIPKLKLNEIKYLTHNISVIRDQGGNAPDFFCMDRYGQIFISEAKGSRRNENFGTAKFESWINQYQRISLKHSNRMHISFKGFVVATCLGEIGDKVKTPKILIKDPKTKGELDINDSQYKSEFQEHILRQHYGKLLRISGFPSLAKNLENPHREDRVRRNERARTIEADDRQYVCREELLNRYHNFVRRSLDFRNLTIPLFQADIFEILTNFNQSPLLSVEKLLRFVKVSEEIFSDGFYLKKYSELFSDNDTNNDNEGSAGF